MLVDSENKTYIHRICMCVIHFNGNWTPKCLVSAVCETCIVTNVLTIYWPVLRHIHFHIRQYGHGMSFSILFYTQINRLQDCCMPSTYLMFQLKHVFDTAVSSVQNSCPVGSPVTTLGHRTVTVLNNFLIFLLFWFKAFKKRLNFCLYIQKTTTTKHNRHSYMF